MPTPTMCYLWFHQGKDKWGITPVAPPYPGPGKSVYKNDVILSKTFADAFTINNGKVFGLPVDHALVCCVDLD